MTVVTGAALAESAEASLGFLSSDGAGDEAVVGEVRFRLPLPVNFEAELAFFKLVGDGEVLLVVDFVLGTEIFEDLGAKLGLAEATVTVRLFRSCDLAFGLSKRGSRIEVLRIERGLDEAEETLLLVKLLIALEKVLADAVCCLRL